MVEAAVAKGAVREVVKVVIKEAARERCKEEVEAPKKVIKVVKEVEPVETSDIRRLPLCSLRLFPTFPLNIR